MSAGSSGSSEDLLQVDSEKIVLVSFEIDQNSLVLGTKVTGRAIYRNNNKGAFYFNMIVVAGRSPGGSHIGGPFDDFTPSMNKIMLAGGSVVTLTATLTPSSVGMWETYPTFQDTDGIWYDASSLFFSVQKPDSGVLSESAVTQWKCSGSLPANTTAGMITGVTWTYSAALESGPNLLIVSASVADFTHQVSNSGTFISSEANFATGLIIAGNFDVYRSTGAESSWSISLNRSTQVLTVFYDDVELDSARMDWPNEQTHTQQWTFSQATNCVVSSI
jgi:hypothetical protein